MLLPLQVTVSADAEQSEDLWLSQVQAMGYDIEYFGSRTYLVRSVPAFMAPAEAEIFLRQFLLQISETPDVSAFAQLDRLIMRSCKSAVKGGDHLQPEEIQALLTQLAACSRPWSCPHGRPTIVRLTRHELEHMFKRS